MHKKSPTAASSFAAAWANKKKSGLLRSSEKIEKGAVDKLERRPLICFLVLSGASFLGFGLRTVD